MGHIKVAKANGQFDIVSADNVGHVKESASGDDVEIAYTSGYKATIAGVGAYGDADVFAVTEALDIMDGASGVAPLVTLSSLVTGVTVAAIS
jgi:hypothetical protein